MEEALKLAFEFDRKVLVEKGLDDPLELNCSVLGYDGKAQASEIEMPVSGGELLTFMDKYMAGQLHQGHGLAQARSARAYRAGAAR